MNRSIKEIARGASVPFLFASILIFLGVFFPQRVPWGEKTIETASHGRFKLALQQKSNLSLGEQYTTYLFIKEGSQPWSRFQFDFQSSRWFRSLSGDLILASGDEIHIQYGGVDHAVFYPAKRQVKISSGSVYDLPGKLMPVDWSP